MISIPSSNSVSSLGVVAAPSRATVGLENRDLKQSSFKPIVQIEEAVSSKFNPDEITRSLSNGDYDQRLTVQRLLREREGALSDSPGFSSLSSNSAAADEAAELRQIALSGRRIGDVLAQISAQAKYALDDEAVNGEEVSRPTSEVGQLSLFERDEIKAERRLEAEKEMTARRERQEIMALVAERSIRLNQLLVELAMSRDELDVGDIISQHV